MLNSLNELPNHNQPKTKYEQQQKHTNGKNVSGLVDRFLYTQYFVVVVVQLFVVYILLGPFRSMLPFLFEL